MQDAANALMAELATIDQHGFSAEELDDVKSTRLTWLKNAVDQQAERDLRMLTSRLASSSLNNTPFLSPEETYQLSKRLWQQITVQSLAEKWQQLRKNQDAFWEQMVNNEVAAKKHCLLRLSWRWKRVRQQKAGGLHLPRQKFIVNSRR